MKGRTVAFWAPAAALAYAQAGYPLALAVLARLRPAGTTGPPPLAPHPSAETPHVALVVAAHAEEDVIAAKVANARALDWPADRLTVVVACDGSPDATPRRAREAGADLVLELPWGGKVRAQDAAVDATDAPLLAFSDANALWEPAALRALVAALEQDGVGYACGSVSFTAHPPGPGGTNQEGLYWRYEMAIRARESALASVTGGNGAIYAVRRAAYARVDPVMGHDLSFPFTLVRRGWRAVYAVRRAAYARVDPVMGHDLSFPFTLVRRGWRAVYAPAARATEKMVPTVEGEWRRKRRMMSHAWPIVLRGGLLDLRGLPPTYAWMVVSHRWLRYAAPFLHLVLLAATPAAARSGPRRVGGLVALAQGALFAAAAAGGRAGRPGLIARYYVLTQASIAAGLWDHLRHGTPAGWAPPEGTR